jgi:hypothetical protein
MEEKKRIPIADIKVRAAKLESECTSLHDLEQVLVQVYVEGFKAGIVEGRELTLESFEEAISETIGSHGMAKN